MDDRLTSDLSGIPRCGHVLAAITQALTGTTNALGLGNAEYFTRLLKRIKVHLDEVGKGAGLTGGVMREDAFLDMLVRGCPTDISRRPKDPVAAAADADYYVREIPVSHKCVTSTGGAGMALSWSKNPPGAPQRDFDSDVTVLYLPEASQPKPKRGLWKDLPTGIYCIPREWFRMVARLGLLTSNNKSDNIVESEILGYLMQAAAKKGLFISLSWSEQPVQHGRISLWDLAAPQLKMPPEPDSAGAKPDGLQP